MELDAMDRISWVERRKVCGSAPVVGIKKEFEEFARDCVRLAEQADTPELREKLLNLAREWIRAVMTTSP